MFRFPRRLAPPLVLACVGAGLMAGGAQAAAPPGTVTASPSQMVYSASDDTTTMSFARSGDHLYVDDAVPLEVGRGCAHILGDRTRAVCSVPTPGTLPIQVDAAAGNDTVFNFTDVGMDAIGSEGNDTLHGSVTAPDILVGAPGDDKLVGNGGDDGLHGQEGDDTLVAGYGSDFLSDGPGDDVLDGGPGDRDILSNGFRASGADTLEGGDGERDVVSYEYRTEGVRASIGSGYSGVGKEKDVIGTSVEELYGGKGDDVLIGDGGDNVLAGLLGHDTLVGLAGADSLHGLSGDDALFAYRLDGRADDGAKDWLFGAEGTNRCSFSTTDPDLVFDC